MREEGDGTAEGKTWARAVAMHKWGSSTIRSFSPLRKVRNLEKDPHF